MGAARSASALMAHGVHERIDSHTSCGMQFHMASVREASNLLRLSHMCQRTTIED